MLAYYESPKHFKASRGIATSYISINNLKIKLILFRIDKGNKINIFLCYLQIAHLGDAECDTQPSCGLCHVEKPVR